MAEQRGREMQSLQERVAYLEGRTQDHVTAITDLKADVRDFRSDVNQRFERLEGKVDDHFKWLVGIQVTSILGIFGAIVGLYFK